ncbi:MAG: hypothetical protein GX029_01770 [Pseudomonadaceae bacterium]|nr:hypothetical protein [Pseudomonadaceae bacterium]
MAEQATYPLCQRFSIGYSVFEDRLLLSASTADAGVLGLLLTRRLVFIVLQQILNRLPDLTQLKQTPAAFWQEVLQINHQQALQQKAAADNEPEADTTTVVTEPDDALFLVTGLTTQLQESQLVLAFNGLPMPEGMQQATGFISIVALKLSVDNLHQLLQMLVGKAKEAEWHLPVELPWLEASWGQELKGQVQH